MNELQNFLNALQFYTRIPLGKSVKYTPKRQENSIRYFPFIGLLVGVLMVFSMLLLEDYISGFPSIILGLLVGVLFTGALHEDGLADCCDGFGGGWTKEKVLSIMKDSSIGAYGAIGLIFLFALKISFIFNLINQFDDSVFLYSMLLVQVLSRASAVSMLSFLDYARTDDSSKSKEVARRLSSANTLIVLFSFVAAIVSFCLLLDDYRILWVIPVLGVLVVLMGLYFKKRIGGYTGDCLGMLQQLSELALYLTILILWS